MENPLDCDGQHFSGWVYVYFAAGYYSFLPERLSEPDRYDVIVMPGIGSQELSEIKGLKSGGHIFIRGRLHADRVCFTTTTVCSPFEHPVDIVGLRVIRTPAPAN